MCTRAITVRIGRATCEAHDRASCIDFGWISTNNSSANADDTPMSFRELVGFHSCQVCGRRRTIPNLHGDVILASSAGVVMGNWFMRPWRSTPRTKYPRKDPPCCTSWHAAPPRTATPPPASSFPLLLSFNSKLQDSSWSVDVRSRVHRVYPTPFVRISRNFTAQSNQRLFLFLLRYLKIDQCHHRDTINQRHRYWFRSSLHFLLRFQTCFCLKRFFGPACCYRL